MKVPVEENRSQTGRVLSVLQRNRDTDVTIDDIMAQTDLDKRRAQVAVSNLRARNEMMAQRIQVIIPGQTFRYRSALPDELAEEEPVHEAEIIEDEPAADVKEAFEKGDTTGVTAAPKWQQLPVTRNDKPIYQQIGVTSKGTILVEDEDGVLYVVKELDI